jgi:cyclomaltodextrinase / maltogenic alpha-amylase / neopullulanase
MELSSVFHKTGSNYAYAYDDNTLHIKLQTKCNDIQEVFLIYGDPYDYREKQVNEGTNGSVWEWYSEFIKMEKSGSNGIHDYWFIEIKPERSKIRYAFLLVENDLTYLYTERKVVKVNGFEDSELHEPMNFFAFPFINPVDVYRAPDWVKDTIWYQIFPERFANGDSLNDPENAKEWNEPLTYHGDHYGGDLLGVIDHLDYLKDLGINGIYLTPIFLSHSNHKYDTIDYFTVDPAFGDKEILQTLVKKAHELGIKVMLDIVFNHCGFYFDKFQDVVNHGEKSPYKDWFHIKDYPVYDLEDGMKSSKDLNFDTFAYTPSMPKLNTENKETKEYLLNVIRFWGDAADIDGWRLDVANEVDHHFWRDFRNVVKEINPQAYIVGEVWHDANPWLLGDQFDGVMNYPLKDAVVDFIAKDKLNSMEFIWEVNKIDFQYPRHVNGNMYNLLDSHDTPRFLNITGENKERLKLAYVFLMTHPGAPSIYYGNEVGMTGNQDPDCRRPMIWEKEEQDLELFQFLKQLIKVRKAHDLLRYEGKLKFLSPGINSDVLVYKRFNAQESYYILINRSVKTQKISLPDEMCNRSFMDLWVKERKELSNTIDIKPYGFYILNLGNCETI